MSGHNKARNFTFYMDPRTKEIVREWVDVREKGLASRLICQSIKLYYETIRQGPLNGKP